MEFSGFASLLIWFGHCLCQFRAAGGQGCRAHWGCWACWSWSNFRGGDFLLFVSTGSPSVCLHKAGFPVCRPAQRPSLLLPPLLTPATAPRVLLSVPDPPSPSLSPCSLIAPSSFCRFWGVSALPPHPSSSSSSLGGIRVCLSLDFHHLCSIPNSLPLLQLGACVCLHSCAFLAAVPFSICPQRGAPVLCHCSACLTLPVGSGIVPCRVPVPPHAVIVPRLGETRSPIPAVPHACLRSFLCRRASLALQGHCGIPRASCSLGMMHGEAFSAPVLAVNTPPSFHAMLPGEMVASRLIFLRWNLPLWSEQHRSRAGKCLPGVGQGQPTLPRGATGHR